MREVLNLVCSLIQILCVKRDTKTSSNTRPELDVVCQSSNSAVVDLGLIETCSLASVFKWNGQGIVPLRMRLDPGGTCWQLLDRHCCYSWSPMLL